MSTDKTLEELEQLDVIEANTLSVGTAFHAFRFKHIALDELSATTVEGLARAVNHLVKTRGLTEAAAVAELERAADLESRIAAAAKRVVATEQAPPED